jgi:hypothetical protein
MIDVNSANRRRNVCAHCVVQSCVHVSIQRCLRCYGEIEREKKHTRTIVRIDILYALRWSSPARSVTQKVVENSRCVRTRALTSNVLLFFSRTDRVRTRDYEYDPVLVVRRVGRTLQRYARGDAFNDRYNNVSTRRTRITLQRVRIYNILCGGR